jgi:hypothetical protein
MLVLDGAAQISPADAASGKIGNGLDLSAGAVTMVNDRTSLLAFYATDFPAKETGHNVPAAMNVIMGTDQRTHAYWIAAAARDAKGRTGDAACRAGQLFNRNLGAGGDKTGSSGGNPDNAVRTLPVEQ